MIPRAEVFEELIADLRLEFEAVAPGAVDGSGVVALQRMVEYAVGEVFDLQVEDRICGYLSYALG